MFKPAGFWPGEISRSFGTSAKKFSWNQKRLHHDLSQTPLSFLDFGVLDARGGGELISVYGLTKAVCLHVKDNFMGKGKEKDMRSLLHCFWGPWHKSDKAAQASALDRGRCICLWYSVTLPWPHPYPPLTNHKSIASGSKLSHLQHLTNHMLTSGASTFKTAAHRNHNASDKVSSTMKSGPSEALCAGFLPVRTLQFPTNLTYIQLYFYTTLLEKVMSLPCCQVTGLLLVVMVIGGNTMGKWCNR